MWKVTAYKNTGINSVNTIDKPARLSAAEHIDFPAFDILQAEFLDKIRVKATREQIKDVDFIALQNSAICHVQCGPVLRPCPQSCRLWKT